MVLAVREKERAEQEAPQRKNRQVRASGPPGSTGKFNVWDVTRAGQACKDGGTQVLGLIPYDLQ